MSAELAESRKNPGDDSAYMASQQKFNESAINELIQQKIRDTLDPTPTAYELSPASGFYRTAAARSSTVVLISSI